MTQKRLLPLLATSLLCAASSHAALTDGLFAYYNFDNGTAANVSAGAGGAGVLSSGAAYVTNSGIVAGGQSVDINTGANKIAVASATNATLGNSFTISAWLKLDPTDVSRNYAWEAANNYNISLGSSGAFTGTAATPVASYLPYLNQGSGTAFTVNNPTTTWFLLTQTFSYDGVNTTLTDYLNGSAIGTQTVAASISAFAGINFGNARTGYSRGMDGQMDEIGLWTRALSQSDVQNLYTLGQSGVSLVSAVPEPSTYGLIGAGALAAASLIRRRRKIA